MRSATLSLAVLASIAQQVTSQYGHIRYAGTPPYLPFTPHIDYPAVRPAPVPSSSRSPVIPKLKTTPQILGLANDPRLDRDSLGSVTFAGRTFWTSRDTQLYYSNGSVQIDPVITSTASWSNLDSDGGGPALLSLPEGANPLNTTILPLYGNNPTTQAFYPVPSGFCDPPSGSCPDGTRYALWPDSPPMIASNSSSAITAYTWIRQSHITPNLTTVVANPAAILYRVDYTIPSNEWTSDAADQAPTYCHRSQRDSQPWSPPSSSGSGGGDNNPSLPSVSIVAVDFWAENEIPFGDYGNVVRDGTAYLFGQANGTTSLARVATSSVEDKSAYEYWVDGTWTSTQPAIGQAGINITNANAGGQGTYYYSEAWASYVWIGGTDFIGSDMYVTTAPDPTGPWIEPVHFYTGVNGDYFLSAYSVQAHPGLAKQGQNEVYVTYTKNDLNGAGVNVYTSPLVYVQWE